MTFEPTALWSSVLVSLAAGTAAAQSNLAAWGSNIAGQVNVPAGEYVQATGGAESSVGLRSNGTLIHWGDTNPPCALQNVPSGPFVAVACRSIHCIALRPDGTVSFWGCPQGNQAQVPSGQFTQIAAGRHSDIGLRPDGSAVAWGGNNNPPRAFPGPFYAVAGGWQFFIGIREDTRAIQVIEDFTGTSNFASLPQGRFAAVAATEFGACAIREDGTLVVFGGCGSACVPPPGTFIRVAAGAYHFVGLRTDGTLAAWGDNIAGQINSPPGQYVAVGAGNVHSFAVRACRPNCDQSTVAPLLNINDFVCFINLFAAGDPRANCDGSTVIPMLNINDFVCFNNQFGAGCT